MPGLSMSNDAGVWTGPERLRTFDAYLDWEAAIPDYAPGGTASTEPPHGMKFETHDLLIAPYSFGEHGYTASSRFGGRLVIIHGTKNTSGNVAQELRVPKESMVVFNTPGMLYACDFLLSLSCFFSVGIVHRRTTRRRITKR